MPPKRPDLVARGVDRQRLAVRPIRGHGVERIDDGEDPGPQRDRLTGQAARVTGAVPPLLVAQHDVERRLEELDVLQHPVAHLRVLLHHGPLFLGQLARLEQDRVGDADLAHVVQDRAPADPRQLGLVEVQHLGHTHRVLDHAVRVALGLVVAEVERGDERLERVLVRISQLSRALGHQDLEVLLVRAVLADEPALLERPLDDDLHLLEVERLRDVVARALADRGDRRVGVDDPGDHDHVEVGLALLDPAQQVEPGRSGHVDVGEHEVERAGREEVERLVRPGRHHGVVAEDPQTFGQDLPHRRLVVHDEQRLAPFGHHAAHLSRAHPASSQLAPTF